MNQMGVLLKLVLLIACCSGSASAQLAISPASFNFTVAPTETDSAVLTITNTAIIGAPVSWTLTASELVISPAVRRRLPVTGNRRERSGQILPELRVDTSITGFPLLSNIGELLFDQTADPGESAISSQDFEPSLDDFDVEVADDFTVPTGESWEILCIYAPGTISPGGLPVDLAHVFFYADVSGVPANTPLAGGSFENIVPIDDGTGNLTILLPSSLLLAEGTYWIAIQSANNFSTHLQWGWRESIGPYDNIAHVRNPGDGFGTGCVDWGDKLTCGLTSSSDTDQSFALYAPAAGCAWLSLDPNAGITAPNSSSQVTLTVDGSLPEGTYSCEIFLDADNGDQFSIPVELIVAIAGPPLINTNILPDTITFFVNAGGGAQEPGYSETIPIRNVGELNLDWSIFQSVRESDSWGLAGSRPEARRRIDFANKKKPAASATGLAPNNFYGPKRLHAERPGATNRLAAGRCWGYAWEALTDGVYRYDTEATETLIPVDSDMETYWAGDFLSGTDPYYYAVAIDTALNTGTLVQIDTLNGSKIQIGATGACSPSQNLPDEVWTGFAGDGDSGLMYATSTDLVSSWLYNIDLASGAATLIGEINAPGIISCAIDNGGTMYAADVVTDSLYSIDLVTAAGSAIGNLGFDVNFAQGLDICPVTGEILMAAFNPSFFELQHRVVDPNSGLSVYRESIGSIAPGGLLQFGYTALGGLSTGKLPGCEWMVLAPAQGSTGAGETAVVDVFIDATYLVADSTYNCYLTIYHNDLSADPVDIVVEVQVLEQYVEAVFNGTIPDVPAAGDTFQYPISFSNYTGTLQNPDMWVTLDVPGIGQQTVLSKNPVIAAFAGPVNKNPVMRIPGNRPAGTYQVIINIGEEPDNIVASDTTTFEKLTTNLVTPGALAALIPQTTSLGHNYPNPFNPSTTIKYALAEAQDVKITVYDILGQEVVTLVNDFQEAAYRQVQWNGRNAFNQPVTSGVYIYRMEAGKYVSARKMFYLR